MHRIRHTIQSLIILSCLFWGGYQMSATVSASPLAARTAYANSDDELAALYPGLPLEVAKTVPSVVATQQVLDQASDKGVVASGVILNDRQIVTAGHNVENDGRVACAQTSVLAPGAFADAAASKTSVSQAAVRYGQNTDLAVLTVQADDNFRALPDVKLARQMPQKGDMLYFINFQPTAEGALRNPLLKASGDPATDYSKPAIFGAMYLGSTADGMSLATGFGQSYGRGAPDIMVRKGASGGAVINARGELVGLTVSTDSLAAERSGASITAEYGVRLPQQNYQVAHMQPVTQEVVRNMQKTTVTCD
jgi:S1-C subfamily serine protease